MHFEVDDLCGVDADGQLVASVSYDRTIKLWAEKEKSRWDDF